MKCRYPVQLTMERDHKKFSIYVPCGHCAWCLRSFRDQWVYRMKQESKDHPLTSFCTFTYREESLPYNIDEESGVLVPSVRKDDVQSFHKFLWNQGYKFKYFVTSEYGSNTDRPHYHGIYWHDDPIDFEKLWPYGDNNVQLPARESSFKYVLKYVLKGSHVPDGASDNFRLMSRRPGIGSSFVYKGQPYLIGPDGVKLAVPHYYSRNYINSINKKLESIGKPKLSNDSKLDYLASKERHSELINDYEKFGQSSEMSFEDWLDWLYKKDYRKQCQINKNSKQ